MAYELGDAQYFGPGTALIERWPEGFGGYVQTQNFFMTPAGQAGIRGLGCGCGGNCDCGMGDTSAATFADPFPGLFQSQNPADWSGTEWLVAIGVGYAVYSMIFTAKRGARSVKRKTVGVKKGISRGLKA